MIKRTAGELIEAYSLKLRAVNGELTDEILAEVPPGDVAAEKEIRAEKYEIIHILARQYWKEKREREARERKIISVPGLEAILQAEARAELCRREDKDGGGIPDIAAMRKGHPAADAYLKAREYMGSSGPDLQDIGRRAMDAVLDDPDGYGKAMKQMEKELDYYLKQHMWD